MKRKTVCIAALCAGLLALSGCNGVYDNPGDKLGGGGTATNFPEESTIALEGEAEKVLPVISYPDNVPNGTGLLSGGTVTAAGDYLVEGEASAIRIEAEHVRLFLRGASLKGEKSAIESDYSFTVVLIGENRAESTDPDGANAVDCKGELVLCGEGSLEVVSTKNAIKAGSVQVVGATLGLTAEKDGIHAEIDGYDALTAAPAFSYADGGYVNFEGAKVTVRSGDDGVQADTFVRVSGESVLDITANGGTPEKITDYSSDNGSGKGIKAGALDWGAEGEELAEGDYLIAVESGTVTIDACDDAIHSDGTVVISGGTLSLTSGDDAVHAEKLLSVKGGSVLVARSYEGLEGEKIEISGGRIGVTSVDDGINAANGKQTIPGRGDPDCHIIISGGDVTVNAEGDGLDSNGSILISGGNTMVAGSSRSDNAALDADSNVIVNGGNLVAAGSLGMVQTPARNSAQNVLSYASRRIATGTELALWDESGVVLLSYTTVKECRSVILSTPLLKQGQTYRLYGGSTELCQFTVESVITSVGTGFGLDPHEPAGGFGR